jgi:EAL domain-containing protein (putative c-di-GMP-specific phosphodiesterase class I)
VLQNAMDKRNEILRELKTALERNEFYLQYQPIFNDHKMTGVEALVRWNNAILGNIPPAVFIPLAEESNLILEVGQWVLDTACQQIKQWSDDPLCSDWSVAVNVSAKQLLKENFALLVQDCIDKHQIKPQSLQLEITESMLQGEVKTTTNTMRTLKALGIRFSLDDFGTGYSSLNYLTKLPIDTLKVDKSFVDYILKSEEDTSVVTTIISLAKSLKLDVVAEGVETAEQFEFLKQLNCDKFQGYYFSKPVSSGQLAFAAEFYCRTSQSGTELHGKSLREH